MTRITSAAALLNTALQDLHAGKRDQQDRLPDIAAACTDPELARLLNAEADAARDQAARIAGAGVAIDGPANQWVAGILDDAARDSRATEPGRLLDIALVGAIRKAKAAEIVSTETAIALAREVGISGLAAVAIANRAEEVDSDRALRDRLHALSGRGG